MKMANAKTERKTLSYEFDGSVLTISNGDETLRSFDFDELPEELNDKFLEIGRKTKLANFAASAKSENRDRLDMIDEGWSQLLSGVWEKEREGGGPTVSAEVEALAKIKGKPVAAIQKALREYDKEARAKILANPKVVAMAAEIRKAREEAVTVDLDDMTA
jgi:hypothetical protein